MSPITHTFAPDLGKFRSEADDLIKEHEKTVVDMLVSGGQGAKAKWHPLGFMSFSIASDGPVSVVAHVWPSRLRANTVGTPALHNHSAHMVSKVLVGTYIDRLYKVVSGRPADDGTVPDSESAVMKRDANGRLYPHQVSGMRYAIADSSNAAADFVFQGEWMEMESVGRRRTFAPGTAHAIPAGMYHTTGLTYEDFCATLCIRRRIPGAMDSLVGQPGLDFEGKAAARPRLTSEQLVTVCEQFSSRYSSQLGFGQTAGRQLHRYSS